MNHLSLFSGIGGLDLAAEMAGFTTVGQCEWADYPTKVLEKHWPDVPRWRDIRTLTGESFYEKTGVRTLDCVSGGFPCQPHSLSGKRLASHDERDLWGELFRVFCETHAKWLVAENVPGLLSSEDGGFFGRVLRDLASVGCDAFWYCFPAHAAGAKFWGERVALVAASNSKRFACLDESQSISSAELRGNSRAKLWGSSRAKLWGGSRAELRDNARAELWDNARAVLWGNARAKASGNAQIVDVNRKDRASISGNARVVYLPQNLEEFISHYGVQSDDVKVTLYKAVHKEKGLYYSDYDPEYEYRIDKVAVPDNGFNGVAHEKCGAGINMAPLHWCLNCGRYWDDIAILEMTAQREDIVVPINTDGKVRARKAKVIREVPLSECGIYGKMLAKRRGEKHD